MCCTSCQVRAKQQGWELVFCQHQSQPGQPAFALFCNPEIQVGDQ